MDQEPSPLLPVPFLCGDSSACSIGLEALHSTGLGRLVIRRGLDRPSSRFIASCSVVCLPFYLLYRVRHLLGFTPLCGSLIRHCARGAAFGQTGCPFLPSTVKSQLHYKTLCCICEENQHFLSNSFSPGVFRSEDRIVKY